VLVTSTLHTTETTTSPEHRPDALLLHAPDGPDAAWWRHAVIYQVYPRSWADGNGDGIVNALRERPCMLHRFPDGLAGPKVHQKRLPGGAPDWVQTVELWFPRYGRTADELCVTELAQVIWAVQMSTVEFHPWNSRRADTEKPDEWRIDLDPMPEADQYQKILDELRRVNDAIPDEEMTDKISRLEAVSAKIFEQAKSDPDKLPQMRKFMDYYLPTSLKLLNTYAELDNQGVEGENISESKHRIELTMDTLVKAFENQLDRLFASDALDVSADIDVMQNMLRADGLTDDAPFKM